MPILTAIHSSAASGLGNPFGVRTVVSDACSFEGVFLLFLYSNVFQFLLPTLPVDSTIIFFCMSVGLGVWIIYREGIYLRGFILVTSFIPYLLWLLLSATWSPSRILKLEYLQIMFTLNLWCLIATAMIISHKRERMLRFVRFVVVLSLVIAIVGAFIYFRYGTFKFAGWEEGTRAYNQWSRAVVGGAAVLLFLFLRARFASPQQVAFGALLAVCTFFIFVAGSRSALLSLVTPCVLMLAVTLLPKGSEGLRFTPAAVLLPLVMAGAVVGVAMLVASGYRIETVARLQAVLAQAENTEMVMGANRWDYYVEAMRQIIQSPIIGGGVRSFAIIYRQAELSGSHPHNIILEVISDTGMIGLLLFLFFIYMAVRPLSMRRLRSDPIMLLVAMLFVSRMTAAMFGADLSNQQEVFVFIGILALRPISARFLSARGYRKPHSLQASGMRSVRPIPEVSRRARES